MVSAFLNTVKIPELRRRILFTLAVIVIVRLGAAITTPGVNQAVIAGMVSQLRLPKIRAVVSLRYSIFLAAARWRIARFFLSASCRTSVRRS